MWPVIYNRPITPVKQKYSYQGIFLFSDICGIILFVDRRAGDVTGNISLLAGDIRGSIPGRVTLKIFSNRRIFFVKQNHPYYGVVFESRLKT